MRMRKHIAIILMLFANVFILAHGALPHSHHDGTVCLSLEELLHHNNCLNNNTDGEACCEQNHNKHHHHKNAENCDLKEIVLRQDNDSAHNDIVPCSDCISLLYVLYALNTFYLEIPEFGLHFQQKPYLEIYTPPFVGSYRSLRAPPATYFLG